MLSQISNFVVLLLAVRELLGGSATINSSGELSLEPTTGPTNFVVGKAEKDARDADRRRRIGIGAGVGGGFALVILVWLGKVIPWQCSMRYNSAVQQW